MAASNLGGAVARAIGPLLPVSRVADANLLLALPELDAAARRRVVRGVWENLGRTVSEMPHVAGLRETASGPGLELVGGAVVDRLAAQGGAAIFVSGHLANWEVLQVAAREHGVPFGYVYRAASNPVVDGIVVELRRRVAGAGIPHFPKGAAGARGILGHLRAGGRVAMLVDQKMNDGIAAPFFGHPAMTAPSAAALALRFRCPLVLAHAERLGPARFRVVCEAPLDLPDSGDRQADIAALTATLNGALERWIRARPGEWLWLHRRWPKQT